MKKIRFALRLMVAFLSRHRFLVLFGFLLGLACFILLPRFSRFFPKIRIIQSIGIVGRFTLNDIPLEIQSLISFGLTKTEDDGKPIPALASGWRLDEEGKAYIFTLKDFFWQDGTKVQASDIDYNFKDVTIQVLDSQNIKFSLKQSFSPFPVIVSKPIFKKGFVGLGEYKVKKITKTGQYLESIILEPRNHDKSNLKYRFYPTEDAAKIGLKLGEVRVLRNMINQTGFEGWRNIKITSRLKMDEYVGIFLDTTKPLLEEKNFRLALAYALEKPSGAQRAYGPLSSLSWAYSDEVKPHDYDLANAKRLLSKVLEKEVTNGNNKQPLKLKLLTVSSLLNEAEKVKKYWEQLDIKVEIGPLSSLTNDYDVILAAQEIPKDPDQYTYWHSTQQSNITNFRNLRIDKLLEEGRKINDLQERKSIYFDFQRFLVEESPVIFLYHPTIYDIAKN